MEFIEKLSEVFTETESEVFIFCHRNDLGKTANELNKFSRGNYNLLKNVSNFSADHPITVFNNGIHYRFKDRMTLNNK